MSGGGGLRAAFAAEQQAELDERLPPHTEERLAARFVEEYGSGLRYVAEWGKWLRLDCDGAVWSFDKTLFVYSLAREVCRAVAEECGKRHLKQGILKASTIAAVVALARADCNIAARVEQWDSDPGLLNTPEGAVDLATGDGPNIRPHAYLTKMTACAPRGSCPMWLEFLRRVTAGDEAFIEFLRRMLGYCLTGSTEEHALFFIYGTGGNGKGVFLNTVTGIMNSYARAAPIESFTASHGERHPTDLAGLMGARLVTSVEVDEGRRWAEARIKTLTGGDKIAARFMRQDFFEFQPQFKLVVAGNHKPRLRGVDEGIRRRFHLLPFTVTIPKGERDPGLAERLREEWPGILAWMIEGVFDWRERGLAPPEAVVCATSEYLSVEDTFSTWLDEEWDRDAGGWAQRSDLFASWKAWAERFGEYVGSAGQLYQRLEAAGFEDKRRSYARGYLGLRNKGWQGE